MTEHDTLPPGVEERPSLEPLLTTSGLRAILAEVIGDKLTETHEIVKELRVMVHDHERRIAALETLLLSGLRK